MDDKLNKFNIVEGTDDFNEIRDTIMKADSTHELGVWLGRAWIIFLGVTVGFALSKNFEGALILTALAWICALTSGHYLKKAETMVEDKVLEIIKRRFE